MLITDQLLLSGFRIRSSPLSLISKVKSTECHYEGVSKSFRTESLTKYSLPLVLLVEKQHKGLWRQNSLY